jgi:hypothetical protein
MIQRIQSVYLSLIVFLMALFIKIDFLTFVEKSGDIIRLSIKGIIRENNINGIQIIHNTFPLILITILLICIAVITIFSYKNRSLQLKCAAGLMVLSSIMIILLLYYYMKVINDFWANILPHITNIIPLLILIFSILAFRGIKKDDLLVKSYDRLR